MAEILTLRGILDICARQNGKTTSIIEECADHLLIGNGVLVVVTHKSFIRSLTTEILDNIGCCGNSHLIQHSSIGRISNIYNAYIKIIDMDALYSNSTFCGMTINDIIFDCPEQIFGNRLLELSYNLAR